MIHRTTVIGVGRRERGDDGAGPQVAELVRARSGGSLNCVEHSGDGMDLPALWSGAELAIVIDAVSSGRTPGSVQVFDVTRKPLPATLSRGTSSHALGVAEAIELARAMGTLPRRLVVIGIEGEAFEIGGGLSPAVKAGLSRAVDAVFEEMTRTGVTHA